MVVLHQQRNQNEPVPPDVVLDQLTRMDARLFWLKWPIYVARLLSSHRGADIFVVGSEIDNSLLVAWLVARILRKPCVVIVHASPEYMMSQWARPLRAQVIRRLLPRYDAAICVAPELVAEMTALGTPKERLVTVVSGVDIVDIRRRMPSAARRDDRPLTVLGVGRLVPEKGFDLLLRAHARLIADLPHRLRIVGEGTHGRVLRQLMVELGVQDSVDFVGYLPDTVPEMARADVVCVPSRHEGFGLVAFEACAVGTPLIATSCASAIKELLQDGARGQLVQPDDLDALTRALRAFLTHPQQFRAKAAVDAHFLDQYSLCRAANEHLTVLRRVAVNGVSDDSGRRDARPPA